MNTWWDWKVGGSAQANARPLLRRHVHLALRCGWHSSGRHSSCAAAARSRWPSLGRLAMLHRVGRLHVGEAAVRVVVSAPHRGEAFDAARWCIDTVKSSVPIWKHEAWADGSGWGTGSVPITDPVAIPTGSVLR